MSKAGEAAKEYALNPERGVVTMQGIFLEGVKWVIEEAKKLADTCGHEGCEIRYSKPILFKDLEALLKE
jgi:hypothetical protein